MMLNYHEMTMNEPRDSPARRQQYLVICTIIATCFVYALVSSGGIDSVNINEGTFEGGDYIYRYTARDYASAQGLTELVGDDANITSKKYGDIMYTIYLDDPWVHTAGPRQRFGVGLLVKENNDDNLEASPRIQKMKELLLNVNDSLDKPKPKGARDEMTKTDLFKLQKYLVADLPSVKAGVAQFSYTGGFVSALVSSYKVIPAMRKYAKEKGNTSPVVITTCSRKQGMCTHYVPLEQPSAFMLGQLESEAFMASMPRQSIIDWDGVRRDARKYFPPTRLFLGNDDEEEVVVVKTSPVKKKEKVQEPVKEQVKAEEEAKETAKEEAKEEL